MLERYRSAISAVRPDLRLRMISYFVERGLLPGNVPGDGFYDCLERAKLCQADVVLCSLRLNTTASLRLAERLVGKRIVHCPPCLGGYLKPRKRKATGGDRWVTRVREPEPRTRSGRRALLSAPMYARIARARVGMTLANLMGRGIRRKDLRVALRRGYLELSA